MVKSKSQIVTILKILTIEVVTHIVLSIISLLITIPVIEFSRLSYQIGYLMLSSMASIYLVLFCYIPIKRFLGKFIKITICAK